MWAFAQTVRVGDGNGLVWCLKSEVIRGQESRFRIFNHS